MAQNNTRSYQTQYPNWCFTWNNYSDESILAVESFFRLQCKFGVYQQEVGESGTPHLQGYFQLNKRNRMDWIKSNLSSSVHLENAKGSPAQNETYCTKEECRLAGTQPFFHGKLGKGTGERTDLQPVVESVLAKRSIHEIVADHPVEFIKYSSGILRMAGIISQPRTWKTEVFWFHGPTGTCKSRRAYDMAPNAYWKAGGTKWWDGYEGQDDVIIDDYRRDLCPFHELLRLLDRYPMRVEFKGGSCYFRAKRVFITTPRGPRETWEGRTEEDLAQLLRRIEHIENFSYMAHYTPVVTQPVLALCDLSAQMTSVVETNETSHEDDSLPDLFFDDPSLFNL